MLKRILFLSFALLLMPPSVIADPTLVLGRAPQLSPEITARDWTPLVQHLSKELGVEVSLKVYERRDDFEQDLKKGVFDLYFGNPGYGVIGHLNHGYLPLVRSNKKQLEGIIVVAANSGIESLSQLDGKTIAFPSETAFAASLYLRHQLKLDSNIDYQPVYMGSHDNVYRAVLVGHVIAGGGVERTLNRESARLREKLHILYRTPGMSPHPLMAHPRIASGDRQRIRQLLLQLNNTPEGKKILKTIKLNDPIAADYERDYRSLEPLVKNMYHYLLLD